MSRATNAVARKRRKKKVLKQAKGYWGRKHSSYRFANEQVMRSGQYAYRDRRVRKREMRKLWIIRINAAARREGMSYSELHPRPQRGRGRGQPQDARRHRRARPGGVSPICRASPGGRGGLSGPPNRDFTGRPRRRPFCWADDNDHEQGQREAETDPQAGGAQASRARGSVRRRGRGPRRGGRGGRRAGRSSSCAPAWTSSPRSSTRSRRLGSGTRVIGVYPQGWRRNGGRLQRLPARGRRSRQRRRDHPHRARAARRARWCSAPAARTRSGRRRCARAWARSSRKPPVAGRGATASGRRPWSGSSPTAVDRPTTSRVGALMPRRRA